MSYLKWLLGGEVSLMRMGAAEHQRRDYVSKFMV
jgi:hypothetical protein